MLLEILKDHLEGTTIKNETLQAFHEKEKIISLKEIYNWIEEFEESESSKRLLVSEAFKIKFIS
jgi:hypothetical protein